MPRFLGHTAVRGAFSAGLSGRDCGLGGDVLGHALLYLGALPWHLGIQWAHAMSPLGGGKLVCVCLPLVCCRLGPPPRLVNGIPFWSFARSAFLANPCCLLVGGRVAWSSARWHRAPWHSMARLAWLHLWQAFLLLAEQRSMLKPRVLWKSEMTFCI